MAEKQRYSVIHAFHHPTGEKDAEGRDEQKYYTRQNEDDVSDLPASVIKDKLDRGLIVEKEPVPAAVRAAQRAAGEDSSVGSAVPDVTAAPSRGKRK